MHKLFTKKIRTPGIYIGNIGNICNMDDKDIYITIRDNIYDKTVPDSKIIENIEYAKHNDPEFDINHRKFNFACDGAEYPYLADAVRHGRKELVEYILTYPDINVNFIPIEYDQLRYHSSILYNIVCLEDMSMTIPILKLFLNRNDFNVNIQDKKKNTIFHAACNLNKIRTIIEFLLDARVNVHIHNNNGNTARDFALRRGYPGIAKIINNSRHTTLLRIPNASLCRDIIRMIIEEYI